MPSSKPATCRRAGAAEVDGRRHEHDAALARRAPGHRRRGHSPPVYFVWRIADGIYRGAQDNGISARGEAHRKSASDDCSLFLFSAAAAYAHALTSSPPTPTL